MDTLQPILDTLTQKYPWLATLLLAMGTSRLLVKLFSDRIQKSLTAALQRVAESPEQDDDLLAVKLLSARWYRVTAFIVDILASVKLPNIKSLLSLQVAREVEKTKNTVEPPQPNA